MKAAGDLRVKVITDYAASYGNLTDDVAKQLIADMLNYQEKVVKTRKSYLRKFRKAIPETKLARFYQIENKLDSVVRADLSKQVPLVR
jgi:Flp pilus assembly CpaF family ATPase